MMRVKGYFRVFKYTQRGGESDKVHNAMKSYIGHLPGVTSELTPYIIHVSAVDQCPNSLFSTSLGKYCVEVGLLKVNHVCFIT